MFIKFNATQQLLKLADLLRESGDIAEIWLVLHLMLNLQEGSNDLEIVAAVSLSLLSSSAH